MPRRAPSTPRLTTAPALDRDRSRDLVHLRSGIPIKRIVTPLVRRLAQIANAVVAEAVARADLTPLQYAVLAYLFDEPDLDQNALAVRLGIDRNNVSLVAEDMAGKGLLERRVNGADRRARLLRLTSGGRRLRERLRPEAHKAQARMLAPLSAAEREMLLELMVRVIEANEVYARPGAGRRKRKSVTAPSANP